MKYKISESIREKIARSIFLTGSTRSGTTIMTRLFLSLDEFEMSQEPPLTYLMIPMIDDVDADTWKIIFETYLFEDNLMLAIPGRRLNFNIDDDSSIFKAKSREDIEQRTSRTMRRTEILPVAMSRRYGFKMPEMLPFLPQLMEYYPNLQTIVMLRKPEGVIGSILSKGWYSDQALTETTGEWLFREDTELKVPYWVPDNIVGRWIEMSELERCCFCYSYQYEHIVGRSDCVVVDYDDFVTAPKSKFAALAERFDCRYGPLTNDILYNIDESRRDRNVSFDAAGAEFVKPMRDVYDACRAQVTAL